MRGDESIPDDMFSYVRPEQRVPADHPLRPIRTLVDEVLRALVAPLRAAVRQDWAAVHPAREAPARPVAPDAVLDPQRAAAHGAAGLQHPLSVVRGAEPGCPGVGCDGVHQEPGAAAGRGHRPGLLRGGRAAGAGPAAALAGAFHGGRDADRSLGGAQELHAARHRHPGAGRSRQPHGGLPRGAPLECHPCLDDRSRRAADAQRPGAGSQAQLPRACPDGEPAWAGGRRPRDAGHRAPRSARRRWRWPDACGRA